MTFNCFYSFTILSLCPTNNRPLPSRLSGLVKEHGDVLLQISNDTSCLHRNRVTNKLKQHLSPMVPQPSQSSPVSLATRFALSKHRKAIFLKPKHVAPPTSEGPTLVWRNHHTPHKLRFKQGSTNTNHFMSCLDLANVEEMPHVSLELTCGPLVSNVRWQHGRLTLYCTKVKTLTTNEISSHLQ